MAKLYPDSHVEIDGILAKHYELLLNLITLGRYSSFVENAIGAMRINPEDKILDLGAGTGYNETYMAGYLNGKGKIIGLDKSEDAIARFRKKFADHENVMVKNTRIDQPLPYDAHFDKVLTSFVIHGLPHPAREELIKNAHRGLKPGGKFFVLDYGEFEVSELPVYVRLPFKVAECKYAFDYVSRDWESILRGAGFEITKSEEYFDGFARLLEATKQGDDNG